MLSNSHHHRTFYFIAHQYRNRFPDPHCLHEVPSLVTTHYNGIAAPCRKLKVKGFSETNAEERITLKNINDFIDYSLEEVTTDEVPHEAIRIARILGIDPEILRRIERNEELKNNQ